MRQKSISELKSKKDMTSKGSLLKLKLQKIINSKSLNGLDNPAFINKLKIDEK